MDTKTQALYQQHLTVLDAHWQQALDHHQFDGAVLWAGHTENFLFDDHGPVFRANPHLLHWFPHVDCEHAALRICPGEQPKLYLLQPIDYWHMPPQIPSWVDAFFAVQCYSTVDALEQAVASDLASHNHFVGIGDAKQMATFAQATSQAVRMNPSALMHQLDYQRAYKTPFELHCMREATAKAVRGHKAAAQAFAEQHSEFGINLAYLAASQQSALELPYGNIVGLNEHAGVLHYQHQTHEVPNPYRSLLIDAGARSQAYGSDITRTYAAAPGLFADLIAALDQAQLALIEQIKPNQGYLDLHEQMHQRITQILCDADVFRCLPAQALDLKMSQSFFPHGLGHLLGLQTHDVAGQQVDVLGTSAAPPQEYASLRLTRRIEVDQVFTIEPGIYFIPMLLEQLVADLTAQHQLSCLNLELVAELTPFGGIRIEDNVVVGKHNVENLTRNAFNSTA